MNTKDGIKYALNLGQSVLAAYTEDLEDKDFLIQAVPGMNNIAWQIGHIISTENSLMEAIKPGVSPELPEGFKENHSQDNAQKTSNDKYLKKEDYLNLFNSQRQATAKILDEMNDDDLEKDTPIEPMKSFAPKLGEAFMLQGLHLVMHLGQFVPVRKQCGKAVSI